MTQLFIWTLNDVLVVMIVGLLLIAWGFVSIATWWQQLLCKHDGAVNETQSCDAICRQCGKNLGFIGTWREKHKTGAKP